MYEEISKMCEKKITWAGARRSKSQNCLFLFCFTILNAVPQASGRFSIEIVHGPLNYLETSSSCPLKIKKYPWLLGLKLKT